MESIKLQPKLLACHATQIWTKNPPGHRLVPFQNFKLYFTLKLGEQKLGWNSQQVRSDKFFSLSPVSLVWMPPTRRHSSTPAPDSTLQHCYITFIMLISWDRGRSGQLHKCTFSLPNWVQNTQWAPQNPTECQISSKCQWFRYSIKYLAFGWGIEGFELGGELSETGRVGFLTGATWNQRYGSQDHKYHVYGGCKT